MKKIIGILGIIFSFLWMGCQEDDFDYQRYIPDVKEVDSVYFSTGASMMIADGQATLDFIIEAYRQVKITNAEGVAVDSMVAIDLNTLPAGSVRVLKGSEEVGMTYATTDAGPGQVTFVAEVGECRSQARTVMLRPEPALPPLKYVNVVFHVFELKKSDPNYDPLSYQELKYELFEEALKNMNDVFNNKIGKGPNGASANVTFRLAAVDANGLELLQPGYHRIDYDENVIAPSPWGGGFDISAFFEYMNEEPGRIWDTEKYLNIVVIPEGARTYMESVRPQWQIVPEGEEPLPGIEYIITDPSEATYDYVNTCVGIPRTLFQPGSGRKIELYPYVGTFYGLWRTDKEVPGADYCTDTQLYDGTDQYDELKKVGLNGDKFLANNAMDDNRFPSLRSNFTLDQVRRMRYVMANCPGRNNALDE